jgi:hypothetical protein
VSGDFTEAVTAFILTQFSQFPQPL